MILARRSFLWSALAAAVFPPAAFGQPTGKPIRLGFLSSSSATAAASRVEAFRLGLRELGYVEGPHLVIEYRWADGRDERLAGLAAELVNHKVDVIVTQGTVPTLAAKQASATTPIVMATAGDPVATGLVASLARPGGNVTGLTQINPEVTGKRLELLKDVLPGLTRLAVLLNPGNPVAGPELKQTEAVARQLGLTLDVYEVSDPAGFDATLNAAASRRHGGLLVLSDIMFFGRRAHICELGLRHRLATVAWTREWAQAGALMTYGPNTLDLHRRAASYVDRILRGAKPADLPVEQPSRFELVMNVRTARVLGLTIAPAALLRADQTID